MDVVIGGAGTAGLVLANCLQGRGFETLVVERSTVSGARDKGFLLAPSSLEGLKGLGLDERLLDVSPRIIRKRTYDPSGRMLRERMLSGHIGVSRNALLAILTSTLKPDSLMENCVVKGAVYEDNHLSGFWVEDRMLRAKVLVAADGADSRIRRQVFTDLKLVSSNWYEIIGKVNNPALTSEYQDSVIQIEVDHAKFEMVPVSTEHLTWNLRFKLKPGTPVPQDPGLWEYVSGLVVDWPEPVRELVTGASLDQAFVLSFPMGQGELEDQLDNFCLLGDATRTFTLNPSLRYNANIQDAFLLGGLLAQYGFDGRALEEFSVRTRSPRNTRANRYFRKSDLEGGSYQIPAL